MESNLKYSKDVADAIIESAKAKANMTTILDSQNKPVHQTNTKLKPIKSRRTPDPVNTKKIKPIEDQRLQRVNSIWSNFNQNTLKQLFKTNDCMEILFELPIKHFTCLMAACLTDRTKFATLKKFIKENGKIVAEKFEFHRFIEMKNCKTVLINTGVVNEISTISYLYSANLQSILHELLARFSLAKRLAFVTECVNFNSGDYQRLTTDAQILALLSFGSKELTNNLREFADLFCQPMRYDPTNSYLFAFCTDSKLCTIFLQLIHDQALFKHLSTNLYRIGKGGSMFTKLAAHEQGRLLLEKIYAMDPSLIDKITINNVIPCFPNFCKEADYHSLLNKLARPAIAAELPHGLSSSIMPLFFLSCSNDGVEVINKMMDAQPAMVTYMTGKVLSLWPETDTISIFSLLSMFEVGILVLNKVVDFYKELFVDQLTTQAMFNPIIKNSSQCAYDYFQKTAQGRTFLQRLTNLGWTLPREYCSVEETEDQLQRTPTALSITSTDYAFFSDTLDDSPAQKPSSKHLSKGPM
jgi:hypothetical protein